MAKIKIKVDDYFTFFILFVFSSSIFFCSANGIYGSNPGSHYALTRAIAETHSHMLGEYAPYTGGVDYAVFEGKPYSDRAPGLAHAGAVFYTAGKVVEKILPLPSYTGGWNPQNPAAFTTLLISIFSGGLSVALMYALGKRFGLSEYSSLTMAFSLGFGTILFKHSTMYYSHAFSSFLFLLAIYILSGLKNIEKQGVETSVMMFCAGYMVFVEYPNMIAASIFFAYLFWSGLMPLKKVMSLQKAYIIPVLLFVVPIMFIPAYNLLNFNSPFTTAYVYAPHHEWAGNIKTSLTTPVLEGLTGLLLDSNVINGGLFVVSPFLFLSLWGCVYFKKRNLQFFILFGALFVGSLLFYSKFKTYAGGAISDTRYLITVTPLLVLPLGFWIDEFLLKRKSKLVGFFFTSLLSVLVVVSFINVLNDLATEEGHYSRMFRFPILSYDDFRVTFSNIFPNISRFPAYLGIISVIYGLGSLLGKNLLFIDIKEDARKIQMYSITAIIVGLILIGLTSSNSSNKFEFHSFQYSNDGFSWNQGVLPIAEKTNRIFVKGILEYGASREKLEFNLNANDCIKSLNLNGAPVIDFKNCSVCQHCNGFGFDLKNIERYGIIMPGENLISFEIEGFDGDANFTIQPV